MLHMVTMGIHAREGSRSLRTYNSKPSLRVLKGICPFKICPIYKWTLPITDEETGSQFCVHLGRGSSCLLWSGPV